MVWGTSARNLPMPPRSIREEEDTFSIRKSSNLTPIGTPIGFSPGYSGRAGRLVSSLSEVELSFHFLCNTVCSISYNPLKVLRIWP